VQPLGTGDRDSWKSALFDAARRLPAAPAGALVFLEDRQDLTIELGDGSERLAFACTRTHGLAVRGPFGHPVAMHLSAPDPRDALRLADAIVSGSRQPSHPVEAERAARRPEDLPAPLALEDGSDLLRLAVRETKRLHPSAVMEARWVEFDQSVMVASAGGETSEDRRRGRRIRLEARIVVGGRPVEAVGEAVGLDLDAARVRAVVSGMVRRLNAQAGAHPVSPGQLPVVFAPGVAGVLVHEIVGHSAEGDVSLGRGSWLGRFAEGDLVAAPALSVIDDPRRGRGSWRIDDEGQPARPVGLIRNGTKVGILSDLQCAQRTGRRSNGHGRRSSFREPVLPRMGCTFIAAGPYLPEQLLEGVEDGIYVRRMEAASTDPWTGRAVFRVTDADRIQRGRLTTALLPHVLRVDGKRMLLGIDRIADDLTFDTCVGSCVRDGQPLSISVGAPTIRTGLISVSS
jgi:TldD protein